MSRWSAANRCICSWLQTAAARRWVDEFVSPYRQMWGEGLVVEWRYAAALAQAMRRDGLVVAEEGVSS